MTHLAEAGQDPGFKQAAALGSLRLMVPFLVSKRNGLKPKPSGTPLSRVGPPAHADLGTAQSGLTPIGSFLQPAQQQSALVAGRPSPRPMSKHLLGVGEHSPGSGPGLECESRNPTRSRRTRSMIHSPSSDHHISTCEVFPMCFVD